MHDNTLLSIGISVAVLLLIIWRQLQPRSIREDRPYTLMVVLGVLGLINTSQFLKDASVDAVGWTLFVVSLVVGIGFGAWRGALVHVWRRDGVLTRQGNAVTVLLWVVGLAVHLGLDLLLDAVDDGARGLGGVSLMLYLALALGAQRVVTMQRAERLDAAPADPTTMSAPNPWRPGGQGR